MYFDMIPMTMPSSADTITSVKKCIIRYTRENAISDASISAGIPHFLLCMKIPTDAPNDAIVCPDGNEKSVSLAMIGIIVGSSSYGRMRANIGFIVILHTTSPRMSASATVTPHGREAARTEGEAVVLVGHCIEEPLDVLVRTDDAGQAKDGIGRIVGMHAHIDVPFVADRHHGVKKPALQCVVKLFEHRKLCR